MIRNIDDPGSDIEPKTDDNNEYCPCGGILIRNADLAYCWKCGNKYSRRYGEEEWCRSD